MWTLIPRGPNWMPITRKTRSLFHAESHVGGVEADIEPQLGCFNAGADALLTFPGFGGFDCV